MNVARHASAVNDLVDGATSVLLLTKALDQTDVDVPFTMTKPLGVHRSLTFDKVLFSPLESRRH